MSAEEQLYGLEEAARLAGVSYDVLWFALATQKVQEPRRVGRVRLFTEQDIENLRTFFAGRGSSTSMKSHPVDAPAPAADGGEEPTTASDRDDRNDP